MSPISTSIKVPIPMWRPRISSLSEMASGRIASSAETYSSLRRLSAPMNVACPRLSRQSRQSRSIWNSFCFGFRPEEHRRMESCVLQAPDFDPPDCAVKLGELRTVLLAFNIRRPNSRTSESRFRLSRSSRRSHGLLKLHGAQDGAGNGAGSSSPPIRALQRLTPRNR